MRYSDLKDVVTAYSGVSDLCDKSNLKGVYTRFDPHMVYDSRSDNLFFTFEDYRKPRPWRAYEHHIDLELTDYRGKPYSHLPLVDGVAKYLQDCYGVEFE